MMVYGVWMAALCLSSFSLVAFGFGNGDLGQNCNESISDPACEQVFRARATTFASLTWFALFLAWEMVHMRRSFFRMKPKSKLYFTQWAHDVWRNKFLFWAIVGGIITMFPLLYIPELNTYAFKHVGISWEWGIVFIESILFVGGIETWKFAKRVYFRRKEYKQTREGIRGKDVDLETRTFGHYFKVGGVLSDAESDAEKAGYKPSPQAWSDHGRTKSG